MSGVVSAGVISGGLVLLGLTYQSNVPLAIQYWALPLAFFLMAAGANMLFLVLMSLSYEMKTYDTAKAPFITSLFTSCMGLSALIPYLFRVIYSSWSAPLNAIVFVFAALLLVPCLALSWFLAPAPPPKDQQQSDRTDNKAVNNRQAAPDIPVDVELVGKEAATADADGNQRDGSLTESLLSNERTQQPPHKNEDRAAGSCENPKGAEENTKEEKTIDNKSNNRKDTPCQNDAPNTAGNTTVCAAASSSSSSLAASTPSTTAPPSTGSIWQDLLSYPMISCAVCFSLQLLHNNFFLSTVNDQAEWISGSNSHTADTLNTAFTIMLPIESFPLNFLTGKLLSGQTGQKTSWRGWAALLTLSLVWTTMSVIRVPNLQYATYTIYLLYRLLIFVNLYHFVSEYFADFRKLGYLAYGAMSLAGVLTYTMPLINKIAVDVFNSDYTVVNLCLGAAECAGCLWMLRLTRPRVAYMKPSDAESARAVQIA